METGGKSKMRTMSGRPRPSAIRNMTAKLLLSDGTTPIPTTILLKQTNTNIHMS